MISVDDKFKNTNICGTPFEIISCFLCNEYKKYTIQKMFLREEMKSRRNIWKINYDLPFIFSYFKFFGYIISIAFIIGLVIILNLRLKINKKIFHFFPIKHIASSSIFSWK